MRRISDKKLSALHRNGKAKIEPREKEIKKSNEDPQMKAIDKLLEIITSEHNEVKATSLANHALTTMLIKKLEGIKKPIEVKVDTQNSIKEWEFTFERDINQNLTIVHAKVIK